MTLVTALLIIQGCGGADSGSGKPLSVPPDLVHEAKLKSGTERLAPLGLQLRQDTLFVSYPQTPRIDYYSIDLTLMGSISLEDPEPVHPTSFYVSESWIIVSDLEKQLIVLYDRKGRVVDSFGMLPDRMSRLSPRSLMVYGGVLYVADLGTRRVLAISLADAAGITEFGELILTIPPYPDDPIGLPAGLHITADGRVLIGDMRNGTIEVFTCDGRSIYSFEVVATLHRVGAVAFAVDDLPDPSLSSDDSFDPSGLGSIGRVHVVDAHNGRIHVFNSLGRYLMSYPESGGLSGPSDIAIDKKSRQVFIADPERGSLMIYRYQGDIDG